MKKYCEGHGSLCAYVKNIKGSWGTSMVLSIGLAVLDNTASPESQQRTSWNTPLAEYKRLSSKTNKVPANTFSYSLVGGTKTIETNHQDKRNVTQGVFFLASVNNTS